MMQFAQLLRLVMISCTVGLPSHHCHVTVRSCNTYHQGFGHQHATTEGWNTCKGRRNEEQQLVHYQCRGLKRLPQDILSAVVIQTCLLGIRLALLRVGLVTSGVGVNPLLLPPCIAMGMTIIRGWVSFQWDNMH